MHTKRSFVRWGLCALALLVSGIQTAVAACGPLDGSTSVYSDTNLTIGSGNSTVNDVPIADTTASGTTGLEPDGTIDTSDLNVPSIDPPTFPSFSGGTDITVGNREHRVLSPTTYGTISAQRTNTSVTFNAGDYYIEHLDVKQSVDLIFNEGSYFINYLEGENDITFVVNSPDVRIYIGTSGDFGNRAVVAKDTSGTELDSITDFQVYVYDGATLDVNNTPTFKGLIVGSSGSTITFGNNADFHGSVQSQGDVSFGQNAEITYTPQDQTDLSNASSCEPLPDPVFEFRMDEQSWSGNNGDVVDSSSNSNNGSPRNGLNTTSDGHLCYAGSFDGVDDYIQSNEVYDVLKGTASLSVWIKTTQVGDDTGWRAPGIAGVEQAGGSDDIFWGWLDGSGRIGISVANDFSTKSTVSINDGVFHHVVLTRDATNGIYQIFIDGVLNNSGSIDTGIIGNTFSGIGVIEDTGGTPEYFQGILDELKVYNSVLDAGQVTSLYNEYRACPTYACINKDYQDQFSSASYTNSNGATNWSSSWQEVNDDNSPSSGRIEIVSGELRFGGGRGQTQIYRSLDLSGMETAQLTFDIRDTDAETNDELFLSIYNGSIWTTLATYNGSVSDSTVTFDITNYISSDTRIRFTEDASWFWDRFYIDNLRVEGVCGGNIDHLEISVNSTASTCTPLAVTVKACEDSAVPCSTLASDYDAKISLNVSADRGDWSINNGSGSVANGGADDGMATYQFVSADGGNAVLDLTYLYADGVTIKVEDSTNNLEVTSSVVTFSDNAFVVKWEDFIHSTPSLPKASTDPTTAVAGRDHSGTISYITKDAVTNECQVVESYTGTNKPVSVWMAQTPGAFSGTQSQPRLLDTADSDSVVLPFTQPASSNLSLDFVNGVANVDLVTSDVGQFTFSILDNSGFVQDESGNAIDVLGASSQVTVRPFGFALDIGDDCSVAGTGDRRINTDASIATDHDGSAFWAAGDDFDLSVKAVLWQTGDDVDSDGIPDDYSALGDNTCLSSFGRELPPAQVSLSVSRFLPAPADGGVQGNLSVTNTTGFSAGLNTQALNYSEVGIIDLDASLTSYLGVSGANVSGELNELGRFYPYEFDVTSNTINLDDGPDASWTCDFTYQGQPMRFDDDIELTVTALNALGNTTTNYDGDYWKLALPAASDQSVSNSVSGDDHILGVDSTAVTSSLDISSVNGFGNGVGRLTFGGLRVAYEKETAPTEPDDDDVPFSAEIDWILPQASLEDGDGGCYRDAANNCDDFTIADITNGLGNQNIRFGRATVGNNNGSELLPLELPIQVEQWMQTASSSGQYVFSLNADDSCTGGWASSDVTLSNFSGNLSSGETSVSVSNVSSGIGVLELSAPGSGNEGSVNAQLDVPAWLEFDFYGRGNEDPTGTGSFGLYSGRQPIFYFRESYR
jgi:hypothetical protein